jgi:hypothetical protein
MMQFRLRTPHVIDGTLRNAGTIVGPLGSEAPVILTGPPTPDMEGVDDEGRREVNRIFNLLHGNDAPWHSENAPGAPERPYVEDHIDNQEISDEDRQKAADAMNEANARYHNNTGTMPLQTLPHPSASGTMVRPMTAETPQENAVRPDRPLGQQLPDAMPSAASTSPNQERAKQEELRQAQQTTRQRPTPPAPQRQTPREEEE